MRDFLSRSGWSKSPEKLVKSDGLWHMVFCGNRGNDVEHATSPDGARWEKDRMFCTDGFLP